MRRHARHLPVQFPWYPQIIRIQERHPFALRRPDPRIPRRAHARIRLPDRPDLVSKTSQHRRRIVRRPVVHHDQLKILIRLRQHTLNRLPHTARAIKRRNNDTNLWHLSLSLNLNPDFTLNASLLPWNLEFSLGFRFSPSAFFYPFLPSSTSINSTIVTIS